MQLGIFAKTFLGSDPLSVLNAVRISGFGAAHYNMSCSGLASLPEQVPESEIAMLHSVVPVSGVSLCGLSATFNMIHPDERVRDKGFTALDQLASAASKLSIPILTLCTGTRDADDMWRYHPDNDSVAAWADLIDGMARAVAIAERYGVLLGVEPELANVVASASKARALIDALQTDVVKVVLDPANLIEVGSASDFSRAIDQAVDLLQADIWMAHAKDKREDGTVVAAGQGVIDFTYFFRQLHLIEFKGAVVTHGLRADAAAGAFAYLSSAAERAGVSLE